VVQLGVVRQWGALERFMIDRWGQGSCLWLAWHGCSPVLWRPKNKLRASRMPSDLVESTELAVRSGGGLLGGSHPSSSAGVEARDTRWLGELSPSGS
jgi:hypothetical protein